MKFATIFAAVAAAAFTYASPTERNAPHAKRDACTTVASYRCHPDATTMDVCDWDYVWKPLSPGCPTGTSCVENAYGNNIPYCLLTPPVTGGGGGSVPGAACTAVSQYSCYVDSAGLPGIQICDLSGHLQKVGGCPNSCNYIAGIPYCF